MNIHDPRFNINWHYILLINIHYFSIVVYLLPDYYCPSPHCYHK